MTKRWIRGSGQQIEAPDVDAFIADIVAVCKKHNMTIGHEDSQGAFVIIRNFCDTEALDFAIVSG